MRFLPSPTDEKMTPSKCPSTDDLLQVADLAFRLAGEARTSIAVCGGLAMLLYGSPRFTKDVDVVAGGPPPERADIRPGRRLTFGGQVLETERGIDIDWIERDDEYRSLYQEALSAARESDSVPLLVTPEHLAVMKLATLRPTAYEDLMYLLGTPGLVDVARAREIVHQRLGGKFAADQFDAAVEEARWRAAKDAD